MHGELGIHLGSLEVPPQNVTIFEQIGNGKTATVYRGLLRGKEVAVKELRTPWSKLTAWEQESLRREIEIMKELKHPLLVNLLGVQMSGNNLGLITDLCKGGDLFSLLHNHDDFDLELDMQVKILLDVAQAMAFLHGVTPKVVHRDLKSLNILLLNPVLSRHDAVSIKVCDFGQARKLGVAPGTKCVGTQHWMAPEICSGDPYDHHADVFSFAMVMFEVCCREVPFEELSAAKVAITVASGGRPDMEAVPPDCPAQLVYLMVRCWAQDPLDRPEFPKAVAALNNLKMMLSEQDDDEVVSI